MDYFVLSGFGYWKYYIMLLYYRLAEYPPMVRFCAVFTTVFLILLTGDWAESGYSGIPLLQQCVARVIGPIGIHFVTVIVCLFAFTSIIGNYFYAEANILFITKNPTVMTVFRVAAAIMVFIGAGNSLDVAWSLADITMGLEAVVNIIAILLLGKIAFKALEDYEDQMARGLDPVFHESNIGLSNTDVWKDEGVPETPSDIGGDTGVRM